MFEKKHTEKITVVEIHYRNATMPSMASSRSGFSMAMTSSHIVGIFERENGEMLTLLVPEKLASTMKEGNTGNGTWKKNKLIEFK